MPIDFIYFHFVFLDYVKHLPEDLPDFKDATGKFVLIICINFSFDVHLCCKGAVKMRVAYVCSLFIHRLQSAIISKLATQIWKKTTCFSVGSLLTIPTARRLT